MNLIYVCGQIDDELLGGWMDGWVDGWLDEWMDEWVKGNGLVHCIYL